MAAGVPVVASAVGGIPELVGDPAALVPPDDPIELAAAALARYGDARAGEGACGGCAHQRAEAVARRLAAAYG